MRGILVFLSIYCKVRAFQTPYFTSKRVGVIPRTAASFPDWRGSTVNKLRDELFTSRDSTARGLFRYPDSPSLSKSQVVERNTLHGIFRNTFGRGARWIRRAFAAVTIFFLVHLSSLNPAWASSGGRMGGSFKPSSSYSIRSSPRTSSRSAPIRHYHRQAPRIIIHNRPPVNVYSSPLEAPSALRSFHGPTVRRGVTMSDVVLLTGAGTLITYNVMNHQQKNDGPRSALGPGVSVVSLTVSLNVPDRDNSNSILSRLTRKAQTSRTDTRKGVQDMISETSLELLRQERTIVSVESDYKNYRSLTEAEREFNSLSFNKRSKFDRESVSNVGGKKETAREPVADGKPRATAAVVSITLCIEGDSTKIPNIRNRRELRDALSRIASDSQVDDCLLSAEVVWTPEDRSDWLSPEQIYADYPTLYPLLD